MYYTDELTDAELERMERKIAKIYREARNDMDDDVKAYFARFEKRDKEMQEWVKAGKMTEAEYKAWRQANIGRGKQFETVRDRLAERFTNANEIANDLVKQSSPGVYSLNRNYEAYRIEKAVGDCGFTMWDEATVNRLVAKQPDIMPFYPKAKALARGIDLDWGKKRITRHVTSGILRGLSPGKIANELMQSVTDMNRTSAVRAARTGITAAQNAGRMDAYVAAEELGITIKRQWVGTKDSRTRPEHGHADGQVRAGTKEPFVVGGEKLLFPGDESYGASGWNIYNCRCTTRTVEKDGIEAEPRQMRVRDPLTGQYVVVNEMTYSEWEQWKKASQSVANGKQKGINK